MLRVDVMTAAVHARSALVAAAATRPEPDINLRHLVAGPRWTHMDAVGR
jgi:hypothetical protein